MQVNGCDDDQEMFATVIVLGVKIDANNEFGASLQRGTGGSYSPIAGVWKIAEDFDVEVRSNIPTEAGFSGRPSSDMLSTIESVKGNPAFFRKKSVSVSSPSRMPSPTIDKRKRPYSRDFVHQLVHEDHG